MKTATAIPGPETTHTATLSNGLRLLIYENETSDTVVLDGYLHGGTILETVSQAGLANLTASMLRRGTEIHSFDAINEILESVGAFLHFGTGRHTLSFAGKCLSEDFNMLCEFLAECLVQPAFADDQLQTVQAQVLTGIREREHSPRARAALSFRENMYPASHPYARPISGYEDTVSPLADSDLQSFYMDHFGPEDGILVIAGAVDAEQVVVQLERTLASWQPTDIDPVLEKPLRPVLEESRSVSNVIPGKSQSDVVLGWPGIDRRNPDYMAVRVCNAILGQFGMGGRLGLNIRERQGMAYYAYSSFTANHGAGTWYAAAGVHPDNVERTVEAILNEVRSITRQPVRQSELDDVQANITGALPLRLESNGGIAGTLLTMVWYDLGLDYLQHFRDRVLAVSRDDVQRVAQTYLDPDCYVLAVAGPPN